jgi:leucyl aminopeptidase
LIFKKEGPMIMHRKAASYTVSLFFLSHLLTSIYADDVSPTKYVTISTGIDVVESLQEQKEFSFQPMIHLKQNHQAVLMNVADEDLPRLSEYIHQYFNRCGGFFVHRNTQDGEKTLKALADSFSLKSFSFPESLSEADRLERWMPYLKEERIKQNILQLGQFHNRYYKSETGIKAFEWIKQQWEQIAQGRNDISVAHFNHRDFPQRSVILTIQGTETPEEIVVLGGHGDSISGFFNRQLSKAPGADDNASGISVLTEVIRVIVESQYRPKKTIQFMAYAAEEVGLLGSQDVARAYKDQRKNVVGVLQLDMTNQQSGPLDIALMSDFTSSEQNAFIGSIIDAYVKVPWGQSQCGYACSDHASWTKNGFHASIPFETTMDRSNRYIHSANDTLESMGGTAQHSFKFAKLALAYAVEMAK